MAKVTTVALSNGRDIQHFGYEQAERLLRYGNSGWELADNRFEFFNGNIKRTTDKGHCGETQTSGDAREGDTASGTNQVSCTNSRNGGLVQPTSRRLSRVRKKSVAGGQSENV